MSLSIINSVYMGIDYSMSSPAAYLGHGSDSSFNKFFYMNSSSRTLKTGMVGNYQFDSSKLLDSSFTDMQRFSVISDYFMDIAKEYSPSYIFIEGYAMGAKGRVFAIGENTGILKYRIHNSFPNSELISVPPSEVKKFATGKGNAKKDMMYDSFYQVTGVNILDFIGIKDSTKNPVCDLVDSFWVARSGVGKIFSGSS